MSQYVYVYTYFRNTNIETEARNGMCTMKRRKFELFLFNFWFQFFSQNDKEKSTILFLSVAQHIRQRKSYPLKGNRFREGEESYQVTCHSFQLCSCWKNEPGILLGAGVLNRFFYLKKKNQTRKGRVWQAKVYFLFKKHFLPFFSVFF